MHGQGLASWDCWSRRCARIATARTASTTARTAVHVSTPPALPPPAASAIASLKNGCKPVSTGAAAGRRRGEAELRRAAENNRQPSCTRLPPGPRLARPQLFGFSPAVAQPLRQLSRQPVQPLCPEPSRGLDRVGLRSGRQVFRLPRRSRHPGRLQSAFPALAAEPRRHLPQVPPARHGQFRQLRSARRLHRRPSGIRWCTRCTRWLLTFLLADLRLLRAAFAVVVRAGDWSTCLKHGRVQGLRPGGLAYVRFPSVHRLGHTVLLVAFLGLALTGMPLKYSHTEWAKAMAPGDGRISPRPASGTASSR